MCYITMWNTWNNMVNDRAACVPHSYQTLQTWRVLRHIFSVWHTNLLLLQWVLMDSDFVKTLLIYTDQQTNTSNACYQQLSRGKHSCLALWPHIRPDKKCSPLVTHQNDIYWPTNGMVFPTKHLKVVANKQMQTILDIKICICLFSVWKHNQLIYMY